MPVRVVEGSLRRLPSTPFFLWAALCELYVAISVTGARPDLVGVLPSLFSSPRTLRPLYTPRNLRGFDLSFNF